MSTVDLIANPDCLTVPIGLRVYKELNTFTIFATKPLKNCFGKTIVRLVYLNEYYIHTTIVSKIPQYLKPSYYKWP
jgi:hypothetical protein